MSRSLNKVCLIGNLGADPEIRTLPNGGKVAQFSLATSRSWGGQNGTEKQEKTEWHRCIAFNPKGAGTGLADIIERYCKKGEKLYVEGRIEYRQYQDKENQTKYVTEINVREIMLLAGRGHGDAASAPPTRGERQAPARATAAAGARAASSAPSGDFEEFPGGLEADDDLPFDRPGA